MPTEHDLKRRGNDKARHELLADELVMSGMAIYLSFILSLR